MLSVYVLHVYVLLCAYHALAAWLSGKGVGLWLADFPWYAPDLWLTCDHFVGKASAMGQPTRPTYTQWTGNE